MNYNSKYHLDFALARHAESTDNKASKLVGYSESNITNQGIEQAKCLASWAKYNKVNTIICSDLFRAEKTASIVAKKLGLNYQKDSRLNERDYGRFNNLSRNELSDLRTKENINSVDPTQDWDGVQGVESDDEIWIRTKELIDLYKNESEKKVLFVTHAGVIKSFLYKTFLIPQKRKLGFKIPNCGVVSFRHTFGFYELLEFFSTSKYKLGSFI